jgi:hypothetical protein
MSTGRSPRYGKWEEPAAGAHKLAVSEVGPATECARAAGRTDSFQIWLQVRQRLRLLSSLPFVVLGLEVAADAPAADLLCPALRCGEPAVHAVQGDIVDIGEASSLAPSCAVGEASEEAGGPWVLLDDGTGVVRLDLHNYCAQRARWLHAPGWVERGMYVLVLAIVDLTTAHSVPVAYVIKDLTPEPDRLALWWCELVEVRDKTRLDLGASPVAV